ncbi:hypothetical protein ACEQPO_02245 [Bacillus sp. SL00103]
MYIEEADQLTVDQSPVEGEVIFTPISAGSLKETLQVSTIGTNRLCCKHQMVWMKRSFSKC